jgi:Flp pilus assembly protein TadB
MDPKLKKVFALQMAAAFVMMLLINYFVLNLSLLYSTALALAATALIGVWGRRRYRRYVERESEN